MNEGYEFQCGQSVEISPADREKYFVDLVELKRLVESLKIINDLGGVEKLTPAFITTDSMLVTRMFAWWEMGD
ncbi:hypothetical protein KAB08_00937 [Acinetobacter baumannii]|nr:hypothetical protein KAB08_00937 [Acinetobacter baumannii]